MSFTQQAALRTLQISGHFLRPIGYRGASRLCHFLSDALPDTISNIEIDGANFSFPTRDPYWNRLLVAGLEHEPEMRNLLLALKEIDYSFIDGGANFGLWSAVVTSPALGFKPALAIEAASDTYQWLLRNRSLNNGRFETLQRALYSETGARLSFRDDGEHADRGIGQGGETVETISLDDAIMQFAPRGRIVVKLDVEGAEIDVLRSSLAMRARDILLIYEDHGSDRSHRVTRWLQAEGYSAAFLEPERQRILNSVDDLDRLKRRPGVGYNLAAFAPGGFWSRIF